jgi:hypothetical protein
MAKKKAHAKESNKAKQTVEMMTALLVAKVEEKLADRKV